MTVSRSLIGMAPWSTIRVAGTWGHDWSSRHQSHPRRCHVGSGRLGGHTAAAPVHAFPAGCGLVLFARFATSRAVAAATPRIGPAAAQLAPGTGLVQSQQGAGYRHDGSELCPAAVRHAAGPAAIDWHSGHSDPGW